MALQRERIVGSILTDVQNQPRPERRPEVLHKQVDGESRAAVAVQPAPHDDLSPRYGPILPSPAAVPVEQLPIAQVFPAEVGANTVKIAGGPDGVTRPVIVENALQLYRKADGKPDIEKTVELAKREVRGIVHRMGNGRLPEQELEDCEQTALMLIVRGIDRTYNEAGSFSGWVARIANNVMISAFRKHRVHPDMGFRAVPLDHIAEFPGSKARRIGSRFDDPEHALGKYHIRTKLSDAFAQVPSEQTRAVLLRESGYSYAEIAALEGISIGTVKSRINRGIKHLQLLLGSIDDVDE